MKRAPALIAILLLGAIGWSLTYGRNDPHVVEVLARTGLTDLAQQVRSHVPALPGLPQDRPRAGASQAATAPAPSGDGRRRGAGGPVSVVVAPVETKPVPVRVETIGTVQPISTVIVRSRVESQVMEVLFADGALVRAGDVLVRLDSRNIEAQIKAAEAVLQRDRASLAFAESELRRAEELARRDFASGQKLESTRTTVETTKAAINGGEAALESLNIQLTYYTIRAPISGRVGVAGLRPGNIVKTNETSVPLATINQVTPIYVMFSLPQRYLGELRDALAARTATVTVIPQGSRETFEGKVAVIDNQVDNATGTIAVRAIFDNPTEGLWPGLLCNVALTLRIEPGATVVPREAVQTSQNGTFVFVLRDGVARVTPVTVARYLDRDAVIEQGLAAGASVVVDGQLLLVDGVRAEPRAPAGTPARPGAAAPPRTSGAPDGSAPQPASGIPARAPS